jgi:hypothetical protein
LVHLHHFDYLDLLEDPQILFFLLNLGDLVLLDYHETLVVLVLLGFLVDLLIL